MEENKKDNKVKVIYGNDNLKKIITNLLEEKFIETIKECENKS